MHKTPRSASLRLPAFQRRNLSDRVADTLKHYIWKEGFQPGDQLPPERQLAEALTVSRTVLREALSRLIGEGLIGRESPRKLRVTAFDRARLAAELAPLDEQDASLQDLIELRVFVEIGAIEVIAQRVTEAQLAAIEHWVVQGEEKLAAHEPLLLVDARFHASLLRVADNAAIDALLPLIEENLRQSLHVSPRQFGGSGAPDDYRVVAEHRQILEALKRRDADAARMVMLAHLSPYLHRDWRRTTARRASVATNRPAERMESKASPQSRQAPP